MMKDIMLAFIMLMIVVFVLGMSGGIFAIFVVDLILWLLCRYGAAKIEEGEWRYCKECSNVLLSYETELCNWCEKI